MSQTGQNSNIDQERAASETSAPSGSDFKARRKPARAALLVEYDGGRYSGWQRQKNAKTIQGCLEDAMREITGQERCEVIGSGRTDAGVHALGQVAHVKMPKPLRLPANKLSAALNATLPRDIRVLWSAIPHEEFHARYDARQREYVYAVMRRPSVFERWYSWQTIFPFDGTMLNEVAPVFLGRHDFTTFSKFNSDTKSYVCDVSECHWEQRDEEAWTLTIRADRFVFSMVRSLVGAMMDVARGKREVDEVADALTAMDRSLNSPLAPAKGLYLSRVFYENDPLADFWGDPLDMPETFPDSNL